MWRHSLPSVAVLCHLWYVVAMRGNRNLQAADAIRRMRVDQGLTPEDLAYRIASKGAGTVSGRTIRRIEDHGVIPTVRIQFAIAKHFGMAPSQLWTVSTRRRRVAA
jgi:DNA-binding XRE family transcriptional regulator